VGRKGKVMFEKDNQKWLEEAKRYYPGWYRRIEELDKQLTYLFPDYKIGQIKEKFGTLRFYANIPSEDEMKKSIAYSLMRATESASHWTCMECGNYGKSRDSNWIRVLCDEHYQKVLDAKSEAKSEEGEV
jgi:hypothetical protein